MSDFKYLVVKNEDIGKHLSPSEIEHLAEMLESIRKGRADENKLIHQYLVVNFDEPYAGEVADLIETNEKAKGAWDHEGSLREFIGIPGKYQDPDDLTKKVKKLQDVLQRVEDMVDAEDSVQIGCHCTDTGTGAPLICVWCEVKKVLADLKEEV